MFIDVHDWLRKAGAVAATMWFLTFLATGNAYGQTRHHHGRHPVVPTTPAVLAQNPPPRGPASNPTLTEISDEECPRREESGTTAGQARVALRARDYPRAETLSSTAILQCGLPDRYHLRAAAREGRQNAMPDGPERLGLVDAAITDYQEALRRANLVEGFQTTPTQTALTALQEFRGQLVARMQAPSTVANHITAPPSALMCPTRQLACGGACVELATDRLNCGGCGHVCPAGNVCSAGRCNAVLTQTPTPVDHSGRRNVGTAMLITGGALAVGAGVFWGLVAYNRNLQNEQDHELMTRGCATTNALDCVEEGASPPREVADDHQKVAIAFTVGAVVTAGTGLVLRLISPNTPPRTTAYVDPRGAIGIVHHF
jgi:hypothetical protein